MNLGILEIKNKRMQELSNVLSNKLLSTGASLTLRMVLEDEPIRLQSAIAYAVNEVQCLILLGDSGSLRLALSRHTGWSPENIAPMTVLGNCDIMIVPDTANEDFLTASVVPAVSAKLKVAFTREIFRVFGLTEEELCLLLKDKMRQKKMPIYIEGEYLDYEVSIKYSNKMGKISVDEFVGAVSSKLQPYIYSYEPTNIFDAVSELLKVRGKQLGVAESFTGGSICKKIVEYSGASKYFSEGLVCYTDTSKSDRLGVNPLDIDEHSAVSGQVAYEMTAGLLARGGCDVAIATTGYAENAPEGKEGLCYIAIGDMEGVHVFQHYFNGSRKDIIETGCRYAFYYLFKLLMGDQSVFRS